MNKNNKNINSNENHGDHCQHVQIGGQAYYDDRKYFLFSPDTPVPQAVESFRKTGVGQQMSDGTFDFVVRPRTKSRSVLIRKLAHGRISRTQDDGSPDKPGGLSIQLCKSEKKEFYIRYSS